MTPARRPPASDSGAHCFATACEVPGAGETVGMQVPGTCTSAGRERLQDWTLTFGIPQVGYSDPAGKMAERNHRNADHEVLSGPHRKGRPARF